MKTPSLFTRLFGNPVVALCMFAWFFHAFAGWYQGHPSIAEIFFAGGFVLRSLSAWHMVRVHKAWLRQWNDTGQTEEAKSERISGNGSRARWKSATRILVPVLCLMVLLIAANSARPGDQSILGLLSLGCAIWLIVAILARKSRKRGGRQAATIVRAEAPSIVAWVNRPAESAPSRTFATSNLPDYALAVMGLRRVDR